MGNIESMWIIEILTRSIPRIIFHCQIYTSWLTVVPSMKNNHSWTAMLVIITSTCTLYRKLFSSHLEVFTITCGAFWVKKVEATHMRPIPTLFHDMIHKEIKFMWLTSSSSQRKVQIIWITYKSSLPGYTNTIWNWIQQNVSLAFLLESF